MSEPTKDLPSQKRHAGPSDEQVENVIGNLLRVGVLASALIVFAGGLLYLVKQGGQPKPDFSTFKEQETEGLRDPSRILRESAALDSRALIMFGLLLLIATPVARVIFSVAAFGLQRDLLYVVFTLIVLGVLLYSLFSGYFSGSGVP
jgi:uncharacterized membrane protein